MATGELFENLKQYRINLTLSQRDDTVQTIIYHARLGIKYFYTIRQVCALLHCSYDELHTILHLYRIDAVVFLSIYRIPWYDLCAYILDDPDDDTEDKLNEYLSDIARRTGGKPKNNISEDRPAPKCTSDTLKTGNSKRIKRISPDYRTDDFAERTAL